MCTVKYLRKPSLPLLQLQLMNCSLADSEPLYINPRGLSPDHILLSISNTLKKLPVEILQDRRGIFAARKNGADRRAKWETRARTDFAGNLQLLLSALCRLQTAQSVRNRRGPSSCKLRDADRLCRKFAAAFAAVSPLQTAAGGGGGLSFATYK